MPELIHTDSDRRIVERQLGRPVRGTWSVARRCHLDVPMVIESHPRMDDGTPFPTLFWLTCPVLVKRASRLEAAGRMNEMTARLARDSGLRSRLKRAIDRYKKRRAEHAPIADSGAPPGGGTDRVKCLHAHLAHELADPPNPIGSETLAAAGWPDCVARCVEVEVRAR
jgi:uncharacterized protein